MKQDIIVILDLGSEENPRLAREIRALGVYSEIHPHDITLAGLNALPNMKGVILNGGPNRVVDGVEIDASMEIYNCEGPVLLADQKGDSPWTTDAEARKQAISSFILGVCGAEANWNMENFISDQVDLIRRQVEDKKALRQISADYTRGKRVFGPEQVEAAVEADKQREQAEKACKRPRRSFDRGGR